MDSFLEEPRAIPRPTPIIQEIQAPTVPEVSLMFQNQRKEKASLPANYGKTVQSYNAWKLRNNSNNTPEYDSFLITNTNKENLSDKSLLSKKQVRFESPVSHYSISKQNVRKETSPLTENNFKARYSAGNCSPSSNTYSQTEKKLESPTNIQRQSYSDFKTAKQAEPVKPFEKLYMSNLPNRELDLSFLEPQKNPCGPIRAPSFSAYKPTVNSYSVSTKTQDYNNSFKAYSPKFNRISSDVRTESPRKNIQNKPEPIETHFDINSKVNEIKEQNENKSEEIINTSSTSVEKSDCDETKNCDTKKPESSEIKANETVTVNDLLTIIKLQNEQLQKLQTQVEKLVKLNEEKITEKPIEKQPTTIENQNKNHVIMLKDQQVGTNFNEAHETLEQTNENGKKISVGLMTSFEVTYKPPVIKKKHKKQRHLQPVDDESQNSVYEYPEQYPKEYHSRPNKKREYMRQNKRDFQRYQQDRQHYEQQQQQQQEQNRQHLEWNYRQTNNETEYSLGSQESLEIQEPPESPENSIHIDMQEYDTDSSDDECSTEEGWTFYKDILGQVNNLLENSSRPSYKPRNEVAKNYDEVYTDTTLEQIKLATMKRLQNDGFVSNDQVQIKPTEVSFAVKQILMKYLPDDGLANVAAKNNPEEYDKRKPTDISVTAFKYMQQCNVVTNAPQYYGPKGKNIMKKSVPKNKNDPKILDITTLKQQPKFL